MKIYDISHDLLTAPLYPGTIPPQLQRLSDCEQGDAYTLSMLTADLHTGTHADAPAHFLRNGLTIEQLALEAFVGTCQVVDLRQEGWGALHVPSSRRVLVKQGSDFLTAAQARQLLASGLQTLGTDALSVAAPNREEELHTLLLSHGVALLEHLNLESVSPGTYFLSAAPVKISGAEAAFVRALLWEEPAAGTR